VPAAVVAAGKDVIRGIESSRTWTTFFGGKTPCGLDRIFPKYWVFAQNMLGKPAKHQELGNGECRVRGFREIVPESG